VKIGVLAGIVAAAASLLLVLYHHARMRGLESYCRNNLRHLGTIAWNNRRAVDPQRTGRDFWQAVREEQYRDLRGKWRPIEPDPFVCPVRGTTVSNPLNPQTIDYRGPVRVREDFEKTPKTEPIGADRPGNHPSGGHVLRIDGSVQDVPKIVERVKDGDPLWAAAAAALKD
jgi:hypothetical protein